MALEICELTPRFIDVDPFTGTGDNPHPFGLVPTLQDDDFQLFETTAILRYLDTKYADGALSPTTPKAIARMAQVQSIVDTQAYWPLVRMVFSQRIVAPVLEKEPDEAVIRDGMARAETVLQVLEDIAEEELVLAPESGLTLADIHLAPMIGFFTTAPEGADALARYPALMRWFRAIAAHPAYRATCPPLIRVLD